MAEVQFVPKPKSSILFSILIAYGFLVSCVAHHPAPVKESRSAQFSRPASYQIVPGDTLFSIAWRFGLKYEDLAKYNHISAPYIIRPGQIIRLDLVRAQREPKVKNAHTAAVSPAARRPSAPAVSVLGAKPGANERKVNRTAKAGAPKPSKSLSGAPKWSWPVKGALLSSFNSSGELNKGIDIAGKLGEPVMAAAAGEVVYSGSGLRGYGKLLIIKHNETFLSAYAHNNSLSVKEGDFVKVGQTIADMGSTGSDRVKLHFEIRRDGTPVDPLKFLPRH
jgi:lipoprotein NlpD